MLSQAELAVVRGAYAKQVVFAAGVEDPRLEQALAAIPREAFLGVGPWQIFRLPGGYRTTPSNDPVYLYQDALVGIMPQKGLNNGQPSFLTYLLSLGRAREGEHAVHIGAGLGYYTAVLERMVGDTGRVTAIEYEPELAQRASVNLADRGNVAVIQGDGASALFEPADVIFVNAGAVGPAETWLDGLKDGGRLVLPLTVSAVYEGQPITQGSIFLIERSGDAYSARSMAPTAIYPCVGQREAAAEAALAAAFKRGGADRVRRLYRTVDLAEDRCWVRTDRWSFAYD